MKLQKLGRRLCAASIVLSFIGVSHAAFAASPQAPLSDPPSAQDFAMKATAGLVELGPNGQSLALLSRSYETICRDSNFIRQALKKCDQDERELAPTDTVVIVNIESMTQQSAIPIPPDYSVNWMEWTSPNNLLVSMRTRWRLASGRQASTGSNLRRASFIPPSTRILSVKTDKSAKPIVLFGDERRLLRSNRYLGGTVDLLHNDPDHVIMGAYKGDDYDLFRVNVNDGSITRVAKGKNLTYAWYTDKSGVPSIRLDCTLRSCRELRAYRPADGADPNDEKTDWKAFRTIDREKRGEDDVAELEWVAPTGEPDEYFVEVEGDDLETRSIKVYNIRTGEFIRDVFTDPDHDVASTLIDPETGDYAGAAIWRDRIEYTLVDDSLQKHLTAINRYFDDQWNVSMIGFSNNGGLALVWATAPNDLGAYYLYDFEKRHVSRLVGSYDHMPIELDANTSVISIPTRDGQTITGYHTQPGPAVSRRDTAPLILLVHGGPESRDVFDYNRDVQFLASRGFQVLQVNFRGSSGYGRTFAKAGYRQWGGTMHNDVMDATRHMVSEGFSQPGSTCIMGHSYGGYAALFAGAVAAKEFACVIAGAGPSDLYESLKQDRKEYGADSSSFEYWTKSMGDMDADRAELDRISPALMPDRFDDPVLLIHGTDDDIVQVSHSKDMYKALKSAGKDVSFLELEEGHYHNRWSIESSTTYFEQIEAFLTEVFPHKNATQAQDSLP